MYANSNCEVTLFMDIIVCIIVHTKHNTFLCSPFSIRYGYKTYFCIFLGHVWNWCFYGLYDPLPGNTRTIFRSATLVFPACIAWLGSPGVYADAVAGDLFCREKESL